MRQFVDWCRTEVKKMQAELAPLEDGTMRLGRRPTGGDWEDITPKEIATLKQGIANLEALIKRYGG